LSVPHRTHKLENRPLRLSATADSIHSELPTAHGSRLLHPQAAVKGAQPPIMANMTYNHKSLISAFHTTLHRVV